MNDLRPYICTFEDCSQSDETYTSVQDLLRHEILSHEGPHTRPDVLPARGEAFLFINAQKPKERFTCVFCGQNISEGKGKNSPGRHLGQHMEEIAFTVVPKAYEDWEFYSEASSGSQKVKHDRPYVCMKPGCENLSGFTYPSGLLGHQREFHSQVKLTLPPLGGYKCDYAGCNAAPFPTQYLLE